MSTTCGLNSGLVFTDIIQNSFSDYMLKTSLALLLLKLHQQQNVIEPNLLQLVTLFNRH